MQFWSRYLIIFKFNNVYNYLNEHYNFRSSVPARTQQRAPAPQAQPTQVAQAPQAQPQQPGLFAQMAATAGGVAVGSAIVCIILNTYSFTGKI